MTLTACAGALMVSRFSFPSFKQFNLDKRVKFVYLLIVPLFFVVVKSDARTKSRQDHPICCPLK